MSGFFILRQPDESSQKDASTWIAEVSHELRLPVANIRLLVETLLDGALDDPDVCRRMLKRAYQETERLQSLISALLSLEQVSESRQDNRLTMNDLHERAQYALDSIMAQAQSKGVSVANHAEPGHSILAIPEQLDQVLLNLVENAVKFTPEGGTVRISSGKQPGVLTVTDTGIGIPQSEIPKIFQRFYRVDGTQSRGSTGLGLSIVKNICGLHGARITVDSEEGKGSSFTIDFVATRQIAPSAGA